MASVTYSTASGRLLPRTSWRVRSLFYDRISEWRRRQKNLDGRDRDVRELLSWDLPGGNKEKWNLRAVSVPQESRIGYKSMHEMIKKGIMTKTLKKSVFWEVTPCCLFNTYKVSEVYAASFFREERNHQNTKVTSRSFFLQLFNSSKVHPQNGRKKIHSELWYWSD